MMLDFFKILNDLIMKKNGFLGIDVSKGYADFVLLDAGSEVLESFFQLGDTTEGRKKLKDLIAGWHKKGIEELYCGVESTGGYENNWYSFLKLLQGGGGVYVSRLNPKAVKSVSDALLKRTITDNVSAENIASYLIKYPEKVDYGVNKAEPAERFVEGRQFITGLRMWIKQKVQLNNQLEKLLYQYLPELLVYCRNGIPVWLLKMLVKYPSIQQIKKAAAPALCKIKGISACKAASILKKITQNDQQTTKTIQHLIGVTASQVLHQHELVDANKEFLNDMYKDDPSVQLLTQIKGIGLDSAVWIVLEIEDINRFGNAKKLTAYFGTHPTFKQSGDGLWGNHMSKKGRSNIRSVLYMASLSAVRYNPMFKQLYARFRAKGMKHKQAAGVVMNKLLRVIYGILKSGKPFNEEVERKHREQQEEKQKLQQSSNKQEKKIFEEKRHRFQIITQDAPVSGRKVKARKKQLASQTSTEVNTGSPTADANI
jgi:transposase